MKKALSSKHSWILWKYFNPCFFGTLWIAFIGSYIVGFTPPVNIVNLGFTLAVFGAISAFFLMPTFYLKFVTMDDNGIRIKDFRKVVFVSFDDIESVSDPGFSNLRLVRIDLANTTRFGRVIYTSVPIFWGQDLVRNLRYMIDNHSISPEILPGSIISPPEINRIFRRLFNSLHRRSG